ncbi:MCE family protein [bacterium]|nr:MCE family protein [bacterium]
MKVKFTKFEKVAGLFVLVAIGLSFLSFLGVAINKGWFSPRVSFHTYLPSAEGVSSGTIVQMSGYKVGHVTKTQLITQNKIRVDFDVLDEFASQLGEGSRIMVFRPFIIGDKVMDIQLSEKDSGQVLAAGSEIPSQASADLMEILSGKKMGSLMASLDSLAKSAEVIGEAFADGERAKDLVAIMDEIKPLVTNLNRMSLEVTKVTSVALKKKRLEQVMANLTLVSGELGQMIPVFKEEAPDFAKNMAHIVTNLNVLTREFKKITPAIATVAPDLPRTSLRAVEALDEAVVLLKAMQKSFFIRSSVREVRQEEKARGKRKPASR